MSGNEDVTLGHRRKEQLYQLYIINSYVKLLKILVPRTHQFSSVQLLSRVRLFATPWTAARQASLSITNTRSLLKSHVHQVSDAIQPRTNSSSLRLNALGQTTELMSSIVHTLNFSWSHRQECFFQLIRPVQPFLSILVLSDLPGNLQLYIKGV